ncbi:meiosis inhibitor protein 1-like, partial [Centruroides sculpturatus]|uniref:meiosis inhibitor protein 1-like n=1 Tax=Centruroides sculpturatus TaxID=218467 RepID=UPI000C6D7C51
MAQENLLITIEHHTHGDRWMLNHSNLSLCLGCCVLLLEDPNIPNVNKKFILKAITENLREENQNFTQVIVKDENICLRVMQILLELIGQEENIAVPSAAECLTLALEKLTIKKLDDLIVQNLIKRIEKECNYEHCLIKLHLLGNLCIRSNDIVTFIVNREQFLQFLLMGLNYPNNKVKIVIVSIFIEIYKSNCSHIDKTKMIHTQVINTILSDLKNHQTRDLQLKSLALLHLIVRMEDMMQLFFERNLKEILAFALKKLLSSHDSLIQVSATQLICRLIKGSLNSECVIILMDANIPEFLFEALTTQNELLIESLLCCISLFIRYDEFFKSCHAIYGIDSILQNIKQMLELKNWRLSTIGLNLTSSILDKQTISLNFMPNNSSFKLMLEVISKALKFHHISINIAGSKILTNLLRYNHLSYPIPISVFIPLIIMGIQTIHRTLNTFLSKKEVNHFKIKFSNINNNRKICFVEKHMLTGLFLLEAAIKLLNKYNSDSIIQEETFNAIHSEFKTTEMNQCKTQNDLFGIVVTSYNHLSYPIPISVFIPLIIMEKHMLTGLFLLEAAI